MASPGTDRNHHRVQLPGRGLGLECDDRGRLRRHHGLEAFAAGSADGDRGPADRRPGGRRPLASPRVFNLCVGDADRDWRTHARRLPATLDIGHRKLPDGPPRGRGRGPAAGANAARARRQQCHHHHPERRPRAGGPGYRVRGGWNRRPAVHDGPTPDRARVDPRCLPRPVDRGLSQPAHRQSLGGRCAGRPADPPERRRSDDVGSGGRPRPGGRDRLRRPAARSARVLRRAGDRSGHARHAHRGPGDIRSRFFT